jgi:hypothetical protein
MVVDACLIGACEIKQVTLLRCRCLEGCCGSRAVLGPLALGTSAAHFTRPRLRAYHCRSRWDVGQSGQWGDSREKAAEHVAKTTGYGIWYMPAILIYQ